MLFRITPEEQDKIEQYQREHPIYSLVLGKNHATDHDHTTGLVRGRMDWLLNKAVGLVEKACGYNHRRVPDVLRAMAVYHESPPATQALGEKRYGLMGLAKKKKKMLYGPPPGQKG